MKLIYTLFLLGMLITKYTHTCVDLIIFSYNRPLQIYALLESIEQNVQGLAHTTVIYRADSEFQDGYTIVQKRFPSINYVRQGANPRQDFKLLTLRAIDFDGPVNYCMFAVDDSIVTKPIDLATCVDALAATHAYGFYLRLGKNITECYMTHSKSGNPPFETIMPNLLAWKFKNGLGDWGYPNSLDMTIFKKHRIKQAFLALKFTTPNTLEGLWANNYPQKTQYGLCQELSSMVNIPLNLVQNDAPNNHVMHLFTPAQLLTLFMQGLKIDITPLYGIHNKAPHMEYHPLFIPR